MRFARTSALRSPWCLSQSGMPAPPAELLGPLPLDLAHPEVEAAPRLRARLAELYGLEPERVLLTVGASSAMQLAAMRWLRAGARVLVESPAYEPLLALPRQFGAGLLELRRDFERGFALDNGAAHTRGRGPLHAILTNPHNPSGALSSAAEIAELAGLLAAQGGVLVSCEVYMEFARPEQRVHAFALAPNAISIGSLTKAYGLGSLRVGWMLLGSGLSAERTALEDLQHLGAVDPATLSLRAALAALARLEPLAARVRAVEHESLPLLAHWLRTTPGVRGPAPALGLTAFPRIEGVRDTLALAARLQERQQVDVVPGEYFGWPGHLRIGAGVPPETLREALARLARGLAEARAAS
jgi:aspartate/methionine/tyrosine aminotransferase